MFIDFPHVLASATAAFLAGAINSVAGGGTLVSFPTLVWLGLPSITANATSTVAIWPGSLGSIWGFRHEFKQTDPRLRLLCISSLTGGGAGAVLLRSTPPSLFERLVPFLILFATVLFAVQAPIQKKLRERSGHSHASRIWLPGAAVAAVIGGYGAAGVARRIGRVAVRRFVIAVGFAMSAVLFIRYF